jgi:hypothetical protein
VTGGVASLACVTLNGAAETGGAAVQLSSSDPNGASVPPTLPIAQGDNDGCFLVQSHAVAECASTLISASFGGATVQATLNVGPTERITDNADNDRRNSRQSSTVGGKVLWHNDNDVYFDDGTTTQMVQARGGLDLVSNEVFGLGGGGSEDDFLATKLGQGQVRYFEGFNDRWHCPLPIHSVKQIERRQLCPMLAARWPRVEMDPDAPNLKVGYTPRTVCASFVR